MTNHTSPAEKRETAIRVLVADDHAIVRKGICALLATEASIEVVGEAVDGQSAIEQVDRLRPDVVLMDLVMPGVDGLEATRRITAQQPQARILVLTSFAGVDKIMPAIKAGALGYLLKNASPQALLQAIRDVDQGVPTISPDIAGKLMRELQRTSDLPPTEDPLTGREMDVLRLVAQGLTNQEIAETLIIGVGTVRTHVSNILAKLHLANRTQAALYALREGLAPLDQ
jgi:NarL family two-component system response regulator LiaR